MEVRCGKCNKLFRVSDDKIVGSGIKFACSRCGEYVKITREEFEHYNLSQATASALASFEPKPKIKAPEEPVGAAKGGPHPSAAAPSMSFDLSEPSAGESLQEEAPPIFAEPAFRVEPAAGPEPVQPKPETKEASKKEPPKIEPKPSAPILQPAPALKPRPVATQIPNPEALSVFASQPAQHTETVSPAPTAVAATSSGIGKKVLVIAIVLVVIAAGVIGIKWYLGKASQQVSDADKTVSAVTAPEGLQITNPAGSIDPVNGDLIITGTVKNSTDKSKPVWYVVAEVYDAQDKVIYRAKMLSGKQVYTRRDYDILVKRGQNIQDIKKTMQEQGTVIPPQSAADFVIRIMEPPVGVAGFNASLQPIDPVKLLKEIAEDQKQH